MNGAEFVDLIVTARCLSAKLVAWDVQDLQTLIMVILVELLDRSVLRSEAATCSSVDYQDYFSFIIGEFELFTFAGSQCVIIDHTFFSFSLFYPVRVKYLFIIIFNII